MADLPQAVGTARDLAAQAVGGSRRGTEALSADLRQPVAAPTRPPMLRLGEYQSDPENDPHGVRPSSIAGSGGVDADVLRRSALRNPLAGRLNWRNSSSS